MKFHESMSLEAEVLHVDGHDKDHRCCTLFCKCP